MLLLYLILFFLYCSRWLWWSVCRMAANADPTSESTKTSSLNNILNNTLAAATQDAAPRGAMDDVTSEEPAWLVTTENPADRCLKDRQWQYFLASSLIVFFFGLFVILAFRLAQHLCPLLRRSRRSRNAAFAAKATTTTTVTKSGGQEDEVQVSPWTRLKWHAEGWISGQTITGRILVRWQTNGENTVLCNWNWSWKWNSLLFPFHFPHLFHTNPPDGNFYETDFPHFYPFSLMWRKLISQSVNSVSPFGNTIHQFSPNFPRISPNSPEIQQFSPNFTPISPVLQWFLLISPDSPVSCAVFTSQV